MGKRDYRRREPKKSKKDTKKALAATVLSPLVTVEVIKKSRKEAAEESP